MLPQKFSPAMTLMTPGVAPVPPVVQALATAAISRTASGESSLPSIVQEYCTTRLRNVLALGTLEVMAPPSPVRDQVRLLLTTPGRHVWSIDELQHSVSASLGGADYSSVFRAVAGMEREGLVDKIDLGDGKAHFELREDHHEHIRCDSCGRVVGVPGCILENATSAVESDTGFTITSHQLLFSGICPDCAGAART